MIGKMYRPLKVLNLPGKRGYTIWHKYKSNFGGTYKFTQEVYLEYDAEKSTEVIQVNLIDCNLPVIVRRLKFVKDPVIIENDGKFDYEIVTDTTEDLNETPIINSFRKLSRPINISSRQKLEFTFIITSNRLSEENDLAIFEMKLNRVGQEEQLEITVISKTPVVVNSNKEVQYVNRS